MYNYYSGVANPTSCQTPSQASTGDDGNAVGVLDQDNANSSLGHTTSYTYDDMMRLTSSVATGSSTHSLTYSYDRYGNMTCVTNQQTDGPCPNWTYNTSTNQLNLTGYTYDAAGNQTQDGPSQHTYQWDAESRLKSIDSGSTATYTYNALGQRVEKNVGGAYTEYAYGLSGEELGENDRSSWTERIVPFEGRHLVHYQGSPNAAYFLHTDMLGTTSLATDYTGAVAQDEIYYPWGQEWAMSGTYQEERFARLGHRDTTETSLDPTLFRMYASSEGRWFSTDPVRSCPLHPQGFNRYAYVTNSPANRVDPTGQVEICDPTSWDPYFDCGLGGGGGDGGGGGGGDVYIPPLWCFVDFSFCIETVNSIIAAEEAAAKAEFSTCMSNCRKGNPILYPHCILECSINYITEQLAINGAQQEGYGICAARLGLCLEGQGGGPYPYQTSIANLSETALKQVNARNGIVAALR